MKTPDKRVGRTVVWSIILALLGSATTLSPIRVASVAMATPNEAKIHGRWKSAAVAPGGPTLVLDIASCASDWCGVEVRENTCGRTSLRLHFDSEQDALIGRFEPSQEGKPYAVHVFLAYENGQPKLHLHGQFGETFAPWARVIPLVLVFERAGEPECEPDAKLS